MVTHSSILAWKTPWTEEPGELQSKGLQRGMDERDMNDSRGMGKAKVVLQGEMMAVAEALDTLPRVPWTSSGLTCTCAGWFQVQ